MKEELVCLHKIGDTEYKLIRVADGTAFNLYNREFGEDWRFVMTYSPYSVYSAFIDEAMKQFIKI